MFVSTNTFLRGAKYKLSECINNSLTVCFNVGVDNGSYTYVREL